MARGFLSGAIWGTVLSVGGLGALSVVTSGQTDAPISTAEMPVSQSVDDTADTQNSAAIPEPTQEIIAPEPVDADALETAPIAQPAEITETAPEVQTSDLPGPAAPEDTVAADTSAAPSPAPDAGDTIAALATPEAPDAPEVPPAPTGDIAPSASAAPELTAPQSETDPNVSTEPAQPSAPEQVPQADVPVVADPNGAALAEDAATATDDTPDAERPQVRRLIPDTGDIGAADDSDDDTSEPLRPQIGTPAASLADRNPGNSARLPSIGGAADADTAAPAEAPPALDARPPLERYAADVDSDPSLPRMSIVMIDDGTGPLGPDTLGTFPFPVTFALDPGKPNAADRMAAYRALGYEVATLIDLPEAAQPTDVEQILGGAIAALPETVALIEAPGSGLQASRAVTEQATRFAADSGHGLVFLPNGLNTAQAIAQRENVPSVSILRDFDGEGQDARTKRRFLDGAAFRARQDGAVIMLGRLTPDTLSALVLWSLQDRAASVSMVPVSTLLIEQSQ